MPTLIDGKMVSALVRDRVRAGVDAFKSTFGLTPGLATVLVGQNAASQVYIKNKIAATSACGMESFHHDLPEVTTQTDLLKLIAQLNHDPRVQGILVQMPLPKQISAVAVIHAIAPAKDVDGFHPANMGLLMSDNRDLSQALLPCTPLGIMELLLHYKIDVAGKDAIVIGRSAIVGKPAAMLLLAQNATVTLVHSQTRQLPDKVRAADIVVAAVGRARFVKGEWVKPGAVVIDVGINRMEDGKLCGDVDFEAASQNAAFITPVPGGVGPMTIAMLLSNTLKAAQAQQSMPSGGHS